MAATLTKAEHAIAEAGGQALRQALNGDSSALSDWLTTPDPLCSTAKKHELTVYGLALLLAEASTKIAALEQEIGALKSQPKGIRDAGPWKAATTYHPGDVTSFQGSAWICQETNVVRPNDPNLGHKAWRLLVKAGRDGKDLRE